MAHSYTLKSDRSMPRWRPSFRAISLAVFLLMPGACTRLLRQEPARWAESPDEALGAEELPELHWVLGGTRLMVGGRWLLDPATGSFSSLPYETRRPLEGGGTLVLQTALSPSGDRIAVSDGQTLRQGPVTGPLEPPLPLPSLPALQDGGAPSQPRSALFWASEHQLVVYQVDVATGEGPWCSLLDVRQGGWRRVQGCPSASFHQVWHVLSGVQGWLVLFSAGEGVPGMNLEHYSPDGKEHEAEALPIELHPDGHMNAQFATDAVRLHLATPCVLERSQPPPCEEVEVNAPWRLYSWSGPGSRLVSRRHDLPPYSMPHPSGSRWAWPEARRICLAGTSSPAACFPLPTRPASP